MTNVRKVSRPFAPFFNDNFFNMDWPKAMANHNISTPSVNIKDEDKAFELELAAPGLTKEDFNLELNKNLLTISVEKRVEDETTEDNYTRKEFSFESFKRTFTLPTIVEATKITAKYENGILFIRIPKRKEAIPVNKVIKID